MKVFTMPVLLQNACVLFLCIGCTTMEPAVDHPVTPTPCTQCEITLTPISVISDEDVPGELPWQALYPVMDSRGRMFIPAQNRTSVLVFTASGEFLTRLGSAGEGPGEFSSVRRVFVGTDDSLFVSEFRQRMTIFSPDLSLARTIPFEFLPSAMLEDAHFVVSDQVFSPELIGYPMHLVSPTGRLVRSFGVDTALYDPAERLAMKRLVAPSLDGGILSVMPGRYVIQHWDSKATRILDSIVVRSSWFKEITAFPSDERIRPPAVIESFWEDPSGILWFLIRDADLHWKVPPRANEDRPQPLEEYEAVYDWVLEAVDAKSGSVVASRRSPTILYGRPPSRVVVSTAPDSSTNEVVRYRIWRPTLTERGAP